MDLTGDYPTPDWLDGLLFPWLEGDIFVDPATGDMRPPLSGQELFRVGLAAGDEALTALGAALHRAHKLPSATVTGRLLDLSCAGMLAAAEDGQAAPAQARRHRPQPGDAVPLQRHDLRHAHRRRAGQRGQPRAVRRGEAHTGGGSRPRGPAADRRRAPAGRPRRSAPEAAFGADVCPADFEVRPDRELMSVDLTHAWPAGAAARSVQRTAMVLREQGALRLVDAFDLERPAPVAFRFVTPRPPERLAAGGLRLGPVDLAWDGNLDCDIAPLGLRFPAGDAAGEPLYAVTLTTRQSVTRGFFTFSFTAAE